MQIAKDFQCLKPTGTLIYNSCPFYHLICENQIKYYKLVKKRKYARVGLNYDKTGIIV
jgi:hypothetical protein